MSLFIKQREMPVGPEKNPVTAMLIYEALKDYNGEVSSVFSYAGLNVPISWIKWVKNDAKRLETEIITYVTNNPNCLAAEVLGTLSSAYLTTNTIGTDVIHYNPTFDEDRTFNQFKTLINS